VRTLLAKTQTINDELSFAPFPAWVREDVHGRAATISLRYNSIRRLKNKQSIRVIPVVDQSTLDALRMRIARANAKPTDPAFLR
jgi:hypothetical protein